MFAITLFWQDLCDRCIEAILIGLKIFILDVCTSQTDRNCNPNLSRDEAVVEY